MPQPISGHLYQFNKICSDLAEKKFSVIDDFLPPEIFLKIRREILRLHREGSTRPAKIGRQNTAAENAGIRSDHIFWINQQNPPPKFIPVISAIESLRLTLKENLFLPLNDTEQHFAVYPPGAFYQKHLDCHRNSNSRIITFILYFNRRNRSSKNGGQLRFWHDKENFTDFIPLGNRLILFSSPDFYHEVLPSKNFHRCSFTGWFRNSSLPI